MTEATAPIESLSFEEAMIELEKIVRQLEDGKVPLEQAMNFYERGTQLKSACDKMLKAAKLKVEQVQLGADGAPSSVTTSHLEDEFQGE